MEKDYRFGDKHKTLIAITEARPRSEMVRPNHPVKVVIRPGLWIYASEGADVARIKRKYKDR